MQGKQPWIEQAVGVHASSQGEQTLPVLVRAALAHVQFETIHPFLDGNGRLGRLLIVLVLIDAEVLRQPLCSTSACFCSTAAAATGSWTGFANTGTGQIRIDFFLEGVKSTATAAVKTANRLLDLFRADEARLVGLGRSAPSVL